MRSEIEALPPSEWVLRFDDSFHFAVAFCAALAAGKTVLLPGNARPEAIASLANARRGCLYDGEPPARFDVALQPPPPNGAGSTDSLAIGDADSLRITLLTSGSTGQPKPVLKSLSNLLAEVTALEATWGDQLDGSRVVSTVSHQHIYGLLFRVLWPLCAGRPFDRHSLLFPEQVMEQASENAVLVASPAILKRMDTGSSSAYRAIFSSGGALPPDAVARCARHLGCQPIEVFGSTETGGIAWRRTTAPEDPWTLFPGVRAEIGEDQALLVRSPYVATSEWIATGDAARLLDDRRFAWLGRIDSIVKIEEKRVSLVEVEERLAELEWIREAAVVPLVSAEKTTLLAALVLTPAGWAAREQHGPGRFRLLIRRELRLRLEPAAVPRRYREVPALPANAQGKRVREDLAALFGPSRETRKADPFLSAQAVMAECESVRGRSELA